MSPLPTFTALSVMLALSTALPSTSASSTPIPPSQDPFYTAPHAFESAEPGTILRLRAAPGNLTTVIGNCSAAYNILYRTTDGRYHPSWAVTTLYVPSSSAPTVGDALLSYQMPYNTPNVDYSPSYDFYSAAPADIGLALGRGWYVNVPDHEGPLAADGANIGDGYATLDSVRAALASGFGLRDDARYAMWGYSGGGLASENAAELQVQYAPELAFSGMALGGLPPNMTAVFDAVNGAPLAAIIPLSLIGSTRLYPAAERYLLAQLKTEGPYNRTGFLAARQMSATQGFAYFANQSLWDYFVNGRDVIESKEIQHVLDDQGYMGHHGTPHMPIFMYKAIGDEAAPIEGVDELVDRYCNVGASILYERNTVGGHLEEMVNGDARAFEWLAAALDGTLSTKYPTDGCTTKNVTVNVTG